MIALSYAASGALLALTGYAFARVGAAAVAAFLGVSAEGKPLEAIAEAR
jgi:hypothetical protein